MIAPTLAGGPRLIDAVAGEREGLKAAVEAWFAAGVPGVRLERLPLGPHELAAEVSASLLDALDATIVELCLAGWRNWRELRALTDPGRHPPGSIHRVPLFAHGLRSSHRPRVAILVDGRPRAELLFAFEAALDLEGFHLTIRDGRITRVEAGSCRLGAGLIHAERELWRLRPAEVMLPARIDLPDGIALG